MAKIHLSASAVVYSVDDKQFPILVLTATDDNGNPVKNLKQNNFVVWATVRTGGTYPYDCLHGLEIFKFKDAGKVTTGVRKIFGVYQMNLSDSSRNEGFRNPPINTILTIRVQIIGTGGPGGRGAGGPVDEGYTTTIIQDHSLPY
jgi:hypothetical protein